MTTRRTPRGNMDCCMALGLVLCFVSLLRISFWPGVSQMPSSTRSLLLGILPYSPSSLQFPHLPFRLALSWHRDKLRGHGILLSVSYLYHSRLSTSPALVSWRNQLDFTHR